MPLATNQPGTVKTHVPTVWEVSGNGKMALVSLEMIPQVYPVRGTMGLVPTNMQMHEFAKSVGIFTSRSTDIYIDLTQLQELTNVLHFVVRDVFTGETTPFKATLATRLVFSKI